jgi:hypothetical protein
MVFRRKAMNHIGSTRIGKWVLALLLLAIFTAPQVFAAGTDPEPTATQPQNSPSGFNIGKTRMFIGAHAGMNFPNAASDLFAMVTRELTLKKKDFRSPFFRVDFGYSIQSHLTAVFAVEYSKVSQVSEFRHWVDDNGNSIVQTTHLSELPITGTLRYYPLKTGESVGSYVWMPARFSPYIAAGAGVMRYNFSQEGFFVNFRTFDITEDSLVSEGFVPAAHVAAGFDINISKRVFANFEARYVFANADLSQDFSGFQPLDLKGLKASGGFGIRF